MKRLSLFLMTIAILSLSACSSDDDNSSSGTIEGDWTVQSLTTHTEFSFQDETIVTDAEAIDIENNSLMQFKDDMTYHSVTGDFTFKVTTKINGQESTEEQEVEGSTDDGTWIKDGDKLTLISDEDQDSQEMTIEKLTGSTLVLKSSESSDMMGESTVKMTLKRK